MTLESLLLSQDPELVRVIRPTLEQLSIDVEICHEARAGADMLISDKFDAVIVDCDDLKGGLALLQGLRNTPSNKNSVAFATNSLRRSSGESRFCFGRARLGEPFFFMMACRFSSRPAQKVRSLRAQTEEARSDCRNRPRPRRGK